MAERPPSPAQHDPASDARFRLLVESATDFAIITMDDAGTIETWNAGAEQVLGWSAAEAIGRKIDLIFVPDDLAADVVARECETAKAQGRASDERWHLRKDGSRFWASGMLIALVDDAGRRFGLAKILRDLTDRRQSQQLQSAQRAVLEEIARGAPLADVLRAVVDLLESQIPHARAAVQLAPAHPAAAGHTTAGATAAAGHTTAGVTAGPTTPGHAAAPASAPAPTREWVTPLDDIEGRHLGRVIVGFDAPRIPAVDEQGAVDVAVQLVATVLHRERLIHELAAERRLLQTVLEQAPLGINIAQARSGRIWFTNARVAALFGRAPRPGSVADYGADYHGLHSDGRPIAPDEWPLSRALTRGEVIRDEPVFIEHPSGRQIEARATAAPVRDDEGQIIAAVEMLWDMTEARRADRQLLDAQRMRAVGTLAGGVAHEINNQMTAVLGFGELVLQALGPAHPQTADLRQLLEAAQRAAQVSQRLLTFTRQQVVRPRAVDLVELVVRLAPALRELLGADRTLDVAGADAAQPIHADPAQVEQVLVDLVANARDATAPGGRVTITLADAELRAHEVVGDRTVAAPGRYAVLAVRDTGHGMDAATRARIFEPFFTTREVGKGTGLGLPSVYGIVLKHDGYVTVESAPGEGTVVTTYWPAAEVAAPPPERPAVLVVEDDPVVRALAARTLEGEGFAVVTADDGDAALALLRERGAPPALVVTDAIMPNLNGRELAHAVATLHPGLPILFMSGYPREDVMQRQLVPAGAPYLQKPYTPDALVRAVRALVP